MDEKPDQIIGHIESQRSELGRNLNELETRVRATTNWRTYFDRNPGMAMGAALGGGLLLGVMVSSKRHSGSRSSYRSSSSGRSSSSSYAGAAAGGAAMGLSSSGSSGSSSSRSPKVPSPVTSQQLRQVSETLDHVKAALIGFGISKAKEFLSQAIPGLDTHLNDAEQRGRQHSSGPSSSQTWQSGSPTANPDRPTSGSHSWQSAGAQHTEPSPVSF
jgi:hypothetical protein